MDFNDFKADRTGWTSQLYFCKYFRLNGRVAKANDREINRGNVNLMGNAHSGYFRAKFRSYQNNSLEI